MSFSSRFWVGSLINGGELWSYGENSQGECGVGTTTDLTTWTKIGSAQNWASVACGKNHTLALKQDGTLWAWGDNSFKQLGDGTTTASTTPKQIGSATNWYMIGCTDNGSFALKLSGNVNYPFYLYRWGKPVSTYSGSISTPTLWITTLDSAPNTSSVERFDCGRDHIVMLTTNRRVYSGGTTATVITDPVTNAPYGPQVDWCRDMSAGAYHTNYYRQNGYYPTYQRGIWGSGDSNRGTPSASETLTLVQAGQIAESGVNSSGTATVIQLSSVPSVYYKFWGVLSNNANYKDRTSINPVDDYTGISGTYNVLLCPAGNDIFRRRKTTGQISQATILPPSSNSTWSDLSTDISYTIGFAGFADSQGATSRRLIALKYPTPVSSFTVSYTSGTATVTNTSINALTYMIDWGDGTTTNITSGAGTPGGGTISHAYSWSTNRTFTIALYAYGNQLDGRTITNSSFNTVNYTLYPPAPAASFTSNLVDYILTLTNTSTNGVRYLINWGDGNSNVIASNAVPGGVGGGTISHTYAPTSDSKYVVTLTAYSILYGDGVTLSNDATETNTFYAEQFPTFSVVEQGTGPTVVVRNTSPNTLGATAIFGSGNKWRWDWGDGSYTDVNAGSGLPGSRLVDLEHLFTFTGPEIVAQLPVNRTIILKAYNGHASSPFSSASTIVTVTPVNPSFPNAVFTNIEDGNIPTILKAPKNITWGSST